MKKKGNKIPLIIRAMRWWYPKLERWAPFIAQRIFRMVFYVPVRYPVPEKEKEVEKSASRFLLNVTNKKVIGYSWGDDTLPYVLFVHGWAGRATQFRKFIDPLKAAGFRVIGFDGPAHGNSEGRQTSVLEFEQVLKEIFQKFGQPTGMITHSFGGAASLYAASQGLPIRKLINIGTPTMADEILNTFLRAINGTWSSVDAFRKYVIAASGGKTFEEFTAMHAVQHLPSPIDLLLVHDEDDPEVYIISAEAILKVYPSARLYRTKGLGHTRILKDEDVIATCVSFMKIEPVDGRWASY